MHMSDDRVGSVAKPRICGNRVKHRMPQFHRWDERTVGVGGDAVSVIDWISLTAAGSQLHGDGEAGHGGIQAPVDMIEEAERTERERRGHCHHVGEPMERRRNRAF